MPSSESLLIETLDFSGGEERFEFSAVLPEVAFPERARSSVWPIESITLINQKNG